MSKPFNDNPIFERLKVTYSTKGNLITHLKIQNESMFIVLHNPSTNGWSVQHIKLQNGKTTDVPLTIHSKDAVSGVFLDFTGCHCIISTFTGENYYLNAKSLRPMYLKKFRGHTITAVGWNLECGTNSDTGFIIVGTSLGEVFETSINDTRSVAYFKFLKQFQKSGKQIPVSNLFLVIARGDTLDKWLVFICVPGQLHAYSLNLNTEETIQQQFGTFIGTFSEPSNAILAPMFATDEPHWEKTVDSGLMLHSGFVLGPMEPGVLPSKYCWINEEGLSSGSVNVLKETDSDEFIKQGILLKHENVNNHVDYPLAVEITEFHMMVLYESSIVAYSAYNYRKYFSEDVEQEGSRKCGMTRDASSQLIWMFNEKSIWKYRADKEKRYVWKVFLDRKDFVRAREVTQDDQKLFQLVVRKQAESCLAEGKYSEAAKHFFDSRHAFDAVILHFLQDQDAGKRRGLKEYLLMRLNSDKDPARILVLVIWILDISLTELSDLQKASDDTKTDEIGVMSLAESEAQELRQTLLKFIRNNRNLEALNTSKDAVYRMILSHLDYDTLTELATLLNDYETCVRVFLLQNDYQAALNVIKEYRLFDLYYKFAPELLPVIPIDFLAAIMNKDTFYKIDPTKLLPAFYKCIGHKDQTAVAFKFFEQVLESGKGNAPIHNFLIQLYAEYKADKLLDHLKKLGTDRENLPYDPGNALRLCIRKGLNDCSVFLFRLEGMYESAVKIALEIDVELAKECARELDSKDLPTIDLDGCEDVSKHVWLTIARYMVQNKFGTADVLKLIKESNHMVTVGDLLPLFPEFTDIEALKQPLCDCLYDTSQKIKEQQQQIRETADILDALKKDFEERQQCIRKVKLSDKCAVCSDGVMKKHFVMFACNHFLHWDCFEDYMNERFEKSKVVRYEILKKEYQKLEKEFNSEESKITKDKMIFVKSKMEEMLGEDCPLCGELAIELIDKPFFTPEEYSAEMEKWSI